MNKKKISVCLNVLLIVLEIIGLFLSIKSLGTNVFIYYTQLSNLFLLVTAILYLFNNYIKSRIIDIMKFGSTLSVLITFLVVIFVLGPTTNLGYKWLLFEGANLLYHVTCPILAVITFLFFDNIKINGLKDVLGAFAFTFIYSMVFILLNLFGVLEGPYPFLMVRSNPIYESIFWFIVIDGGAILLGMGLEKLKNII